MDAPTFPVGRRPSAEPVRGPRGDHARPPTVPGLGGLLAVMYATAIGGLAVAIGSATSAGWIDRTISHLGADAGAELPFRVTMLLVGGLGLVLAQRIGRVVAVLRATGRIRARWAVALRVAFYAMALGFLGVGAFRLGVSGWMELAHGTAAYTPSVLLLALMYTARSAVPSLSARFGRTSLALLAAILLLYVVAVAGGLPWAWMELIALTTGGAWLAAFLLRLRRLALAGIESGEADAGGAAEILADGTRTGETRADGAPS